MGERRNHLMPPRRKRRLPPKPPAPAEGMMWHYWQLVPIEDAEHRAKRVMGDFDELPRPQRDLLNYSKTGTKGKSRR
jgi:hypothetical protein